MDLTKQSISFLPFYKHVEEDGKTPNLEQIIMPEISNLKQNKMKPRPHPPFSKRYLAFKYIKDK